MDAGHPSSSLQSHKSLCSGQLKPVVSVIIPVTERCDSLVEIFLTHKKILAESEKPFEFVFVFDGGFDREAQTLGPLIAQGEPIRIQRLPRYFGEATCLMVGFHLAKGDILVTLPAYFQTQADGLRSVLGKIEEGFDLAVGCRSPRQDPIFNRLQNSIFHGLIRILTDVEFQDMSCGLRAFRRPLLQEVKIYGDLHRFLPLMAYQRGFRIIEVPVLQHPSNCHLRIYRPGVYLRRLLDLFTITFLFKFTKKPLRFFGLVGAGLFCSGFFISSILAAGKIFGHISLADRPLLILGILLMVLGVQTGSIGLLGEMIIFTHARKMKDYAVKEFLHAKPGEPLVK